MNKLDIETFVQSKTNLYLNSGGDLDGVLYKSALIEFERGLYNEVLEFAGYNQVHASKILGVNRTTLRSKIKKYNLGETGEESRRTENTDTPIN